jgi:hypothetical protein
MAAIEIRSAVRDIGVLSAVGLGSVVKDYAQIARQMRLQLLGMGALTTLQAAPTTLPEQSHVPSPGAGDTHDGGGEDSGPASGGLAAHPYDG